MMAVTTISMLLLMVMMLMMMLVLVLVLKLAWRWRWFFMFGQSYNILFRKPCSTRFRPGYRELASL